MGHLYDNVASIMHSLRTRTAPDQAGIISGSNPSTYNASDPFVLWVIQVVIIMAMTQLLALGLSRIRQPRVIAEVIGGIILGPTVFGRIPNFNNRIFPTAGMPSLTLTSTIGLVFYLFLIGLEIDTRTLQKNIRASLAISCAGLVLPLGLGAALGVGVYKEFISKSVNEGYFILFTAVAVGITAFPVLCRILTELKLLDDIVGVVTLSAGVGNDVVGWILLALTVALINAGSGLTALWVLLAGAGYVVFLFYPVHWAYMALARRTGSIDHGTPSTAMMTITLLLILCSAFYTDIIGIHPIFGGFVAGLIIPHENGYAIALVEKLEDLVTVILLPLYFTLSGLKTDLGLLNTGISWAYIVIICLVAFTSKFVACGAAAHFSGFGWREAGAIGSLMSCKGLVELIVLNIGLEANILDTRTFSMFVVHAVILTFITTPLTLAFYPPKYRNRKTVRDVVDDDIPSLSARDSVLAYKYRFSIVLERMEQLPAAMRILQMLPPIQPATSPASSIINEKAGGQYIDRHSIRIDALRLIELTNRTSAVLKSQEAEHLIAIDSVLSVFRTFGQLNRFRVSAALSVVTHEAFSSTVASHAIETDSQMVLLPWSLQSSSGQDVPALERTTSDAAPSLVYSEFIRNVFVQSPVDVAVFLDRGICPGSSQDIEQCLIIPFFGGPDDRVALKFAVQLCSREFVTAKVVRIKKTEAREAIGSPVDLSSTAHPHTIAAPDTVYGQHDTTTRLASDTADNLLWDRLTQDSEKNDSALMQALSRMTFETQESPQPLHFVQDLIKAQCSSNKNIVAVFGRSRRMAVESHRVELEQLLSKANKHLTASVTKTVGDVGAALMTGCNAGLLIVQAAVV